MISENSKNFKIDRTFLTLKKFLFPYKYKIIIVFIALSITAISILGLGYGLKLLIDNQLTNNNNIYILLIILIALLALASYVRASTIYIVCENIEADIKKNIFKHLLDLSLEFFESNKVSDIVSRLTVDTATINLIIVNLLSFIIRNILISIGSIIMLFNISIELSIIIILAIPFITFPILGLSKKIKNFSRKSQNYTGLISANIEETLNGLRTIKSYNNEHFAYQNFNNLLHENLVFSELRYKYRAILSSIVIFCALASVIIVLWCGSNYINSGKISSGDLSAFIFYTIMLATSIGGIGDVTGELARATAAGGRVFDLLKIESKIISPKRKLILTEELSIEFNNVTFAYPSRKNSTILNNINFTINFGEDVAIVGASGVGKTSIFNLLLRLYETSQGQIKIANKDIKEFPLKQLRNLFSIVPQEPIIFSASIKENIAFGLKVSMAEIENASRIAQIHDYINSLPNKYNDYLGEKGIRLSGGQKQRIAIARAILRKSKILLLDEATSSLDNKNEYKLFEELKDLKKNRTCITISHRISTIKNADKILFIDNGIIADSGKFDKLYKKNSNFRKLIDKDGESPPI